MYDYSDIKYVIFNVDWNRQTIIYQKIRIDFWKLGGCIDTWETCIKTLLLLIFKVSISENWMKQLVTFGAWHLLHTTLKFLRCVQGNRNVKTLGGDKFMEWSKSNPPIMNRVNYVICQSPYVPSCWEFDHWLSS